KRAQTLVNTARKAGARAHAVEDRAAHAKARIAAKRHAARGIEAARRVEKPLAPEALEFLDVERSADFAGDLVGNRVHQIDGRLEPSELLGRFRHVRSPGADSTPARLARATAGPSRRRRIVRPRRDGRTPEKTPASKTEKCRA